VYGFIIPPWGELRNLAAVNKWFFKNFRMKKNPPVVQANTGADFLQLF